MRYNIKSNIKKKLKIIFVFLTFLVMLPYAKVNAAEENSIWIDGANKVNPGEEIVLTINMSVPNNDGAVGMQGTLSYDKEVFDLIDKSIMKGKWSITAFNENTGMFMIEADDEALYDKNEYIKNGEIMKVTLKAKEEIKKRKTIVEIKNVKIVNGAFETIEIYNYSNKKIRLKGIGDIIIISFAVIALVIIAIIIINKKRNKK